MPVKALLRGLVVIRNDRQARARAGFFGVSGKLDGFARRIRTRAGDDGDAPFRVLDRYLDQLMMFVEIDRRRFAGGADDDDAIGAFRYVPVDQFAKGVEIEAAVVVHRRNDCDHAAGKLCHLSDFPEDTAVARVN